MKNVTNWLHALAIAAVTWLFTEVVTLKTDIAAIKTFLRGEVARSSSPAEPAE